MASLDYNQIVIRREAVFNKMETLYSKRDTQKFITTINLDDYKKSLKKLFKVYKT